MLRIIARLTLGLVIAIIKLSILMISIIAICATLALACHSQTIELKTVPNVIKKGNLDTNLYRLDSLLRIGDGYTTHRFLTDKCRCFSEVDPIAPHSSNPVKIAAFQTGASAAILTGYRALERHNHKRLGIALLVGDIILEGYTVGQNAYYLNDVDSHRPH